MNSTFKWFAEYGSRLGKWSEIKPFDKKFGIIIEHSFITLQKNSYIYFNNDYQFEVNELDVCVSDFGCWLLLFYHSATVKHERWSMVGYDCICSSYIIARYIQLQQRLICSTNTLTHKFSHLKTMRMCACMSRRASDQTSVYRFALVCC